MEDNLNCPKCSQPCGRLIACEVEKKIVCNKCHEPHAVQSIFNWQLHDIVASDGKTRVTKGKASEMDSRTVSPDDSKVIINKHTGRPTQR